MNKAIQSFKLLTLALGPPPPLHLPCSSPNSILALPKTIKFSLPSTPLPMLFLARNAFFSILVPFFNGHLLVSPENSSCISGPQQPCPSLWPSLAPMLCPLESWVEAESLGGPSLTQHGAGTEVGAWLTEESPPREHTWKALALAVPVPVGA